MTLPPTRLRRRGRPAAPPQGIGHPWWWMLAQPLLAWVVLLGARLLAGPRLHQTTVLLVLLAASVLPGLVASVVDVALELRRARRPGPAQEGDPTWWDVGLRLLGWALASAALGLVTALPFVALDDTAWREAALVVVLPGLVLVTALLVVLLAAIELFLTVMGVRLLVTGVRRIVGRPRGADVLATAGELALGVLLLGVVAVGVPALAAPGLTEGLVGAPRGRGAGYLLRLVMLVATGSGPTWLRVWTSVSLLAVVGGLVVLFAGFRRTPAAVSAPRDAR